MRSSWLSRWSLRSRVSGCLVGLGLLLPVAVTPETHHLFIDACTTITPRAVQTPYTRFVPHTDHNGGRREHHDPKVSLFPIGLYHGLSGEESGAAYSLKSVAEAGFNTVFLWEGQSLEPALIEAQRLNLKTIVHHPTDQLIRQARTAGDPAAASVLAWYLDEEPSLLVPLSQQSARLAGFRDRLLQIHRLDPVRPVFALDWPDFRGLRRSSWIAWAAAGDLSAHDNYPIRTSRTTSLDTVTGIPRSVSLAVAATKEQKPVWVLLQAMASPKFGWRMPTPVELRAMTYAALIHGATGIFYFAFDSPVTRDGQVLGVAPNPAASLPPLPLRRSATSDAGTQDPRNQDTRNDLHRVAPLTADPASLEASRRLWSAIIDINRELNTLSPDLLSPTAAIGYRVKVRDTGTSPAPVRSLLKQRGEIQTLMMVNLQRDSHQVTVHFPKPSAADIYPLFAPASADWSPEAGVLRIHLPALGVAIYQFRQRREITISR